MSAAPLHGVRVATFGNLLATRVASKCLTDLGAEVVACQVFCAGFDILLGDRTTFAALLQKDALDSVACELEAQLPECAAILEFTHNARALERDSRTPSERAAASDAGLYESLVPFAPPNVFDQPVCSYVAGVYAAYAAISALVARERGVSKKTFLAVPLVAAGYSLLSLQSLFAFDYPKSWKPVRWMAAPFKDLWRTRDGSFIYVHVGLSQHLRRFFEVLQEFGFEQDALEIRRNVHQETLRDPVEPRGYFATFRVVLAMRKMFLKRSGADWEKMLSGAGLCCIRVRSYEEWANNEAALKGGFVEELPGGARVPGKAIHAHVRDARSSVSESFEKPAAPFQGLKVLDFAQVIAGPLAGRTLAEFGADVLRVENPHMMQNFVAPFAAAYHAGKRKLTVDLRTAEGKAQLEQVLNEWKPDVVLHNFARGVPEKLGISEDQLRVMLPNLIYLDINAFGDKGPLSALPGFEQTAQALVGVAHESAKRGVPKLFLLPIHDMGAGLMGATGVAAAQYYRLRNGTGARIHTSLASASMLLQSVHPKRANTRELSELPSRGLKFGKLFAELKASKHWILSFGKLSSGHVVPLVKAPVDSSSWKNALNKPFENDFETVKIPVLKRVQCALAEVGWGIWWIARGFVD